MTDVVRNDEETKVELQIQIDELKGFLAGQTEPTMGETVEGDEGYDLALQSYQASMESYATHRTAMEARIAALEEELALIP